MDMLSDFEWHVVCEHYTARQHRRQARYRRETGDLAPYYVPSPNRRLSGWQGEPGTRVCVLRSASGVLVRYSEDHVARLRERWYDENPAAADAQDAIDARVREQSRLVRYSANETDEHGVPRDNLDEIPVPGKIRVRAERSEYFGGKRSRDYLSPVLESPTWLDLCGIADEVINTTNDMSHVYFEGLQVLGDEDGVQIVELFMGS
jgi:hypothetical protein